MQDWIYDIDESCLLEIQNMVMESIFTTDYKLMNAMVDTILQCVTYRPKNAKVLAKLCIFLAKLAETRNEMINIKPLLLYKLKEQQETKQGQYYLFRLCVNEELFSPIEIITPFINTSDPSSSPRLQDAIQWFAPEFESECKLLLYKFIIENHKNTENGFVPRIDSLKENNWALFKIVSEKHQFPGTIEYAIANDDLDSFIKFSSENNFDYKKKVCLSIYETNEFMRNPTLIQYAALNSAINIFKYILMNSSVIDQEIGPTPYFFHRSMVNLSYFDNKTRNETLIKENPYMIAKYMVELDKIQKSEEMKKEQVDAIIRIKMLQRLIDDQHRTQSSQLPTNVIINEDTTNYNQLAREFAKNISSKSEQTESLHQEPKREISNDISYGFPFIGNSLPPQMNPFTNRPINTTTKRPEIVSNIDPIPGFIQASTLIAPKPVVLKPTIQQSEYPELYKKYYSTNTNKSVTVVDSDDNSSEEEEEDSAGVYFRWKHRKYYHGYSDEEEEEDSEETSSEDTKSHSIDFELMFTSQYAIAGGNNEIIRILHQKEATFRHALQTAAIYHQNTIFKWLFNQNDKIEDSELYTILVELENYELLEFLNEQNADPNGINQYLNTAINVAVDREMLEAVSVLVANPKLNLSLRARAKQELPMYRAIRKKNVPMFKQLLKCKSVDINANETIYKSGSRFSRYTLLIYAFKMMAGEIVDLLLKDPRINVNKKYGSQGKTPLIWALEHKDDELFSKLINHPGIDVNAGKYNTPLIYATQTCDIDMVKTLLAHTATNVNAIGLHGKSPLIISIGLNHKSMEIFTLLMSDPRIDVNIQNDEGFAAIHFAASNYDSNFMTMLLSTPGIQVNLETKKGQTALSIACEHSRLSIVQLLLQAEGIQVNAQRKDGRTPLMMTTSPEVAKELLKRPDIDVNLKDSNGISALQYSMSIGRTLFELLINDKRINVMEQDLQGRSLIHFAGQQNNPLITQMIVKIPGIDINHKDREGKTILHHAAEKHNFDNLNYLVKVKELNQFIPDNKNRLALHYAALGVRNYHISSYSYYARATDDKSRAYSTDEFKCFKLLSESAGKYINYMDNEGYSPFMLLFRNLTDINLFSQINNIDFTLQSKDGENLLIIAARANEINCVKYILGKCPALLNSRDKDGNTCLHHLAQNGNIEGIEYLITLPGLDVKARNLRGQTADTTGFAQRGSVTKIRSILKRAGPVSLSQLRKTPQRIRTQQTASSIEIARILAMQNQRKK